MKRVIIGLLTLTSISTFASETFRYPKISELQINCDSSMDAVCNHLGFHKAVEFTCKSPLRAMLIGVQQEVQNQKSVNVKFKPCQERGLGIGAADVMNSTEIKCNTYASYSNESRETKILKIIKCD